MKLCCFFNYPPHYRESIFRKIDETFDTRFYFGRSVPGNEGGSPIRKVDFGIFRHKPVEMANVNLLGRFPWRSKFLSAGFGDHDAVIVSGDLCYSHIPLAIICRLTGKKFYGWGHGPKKKHGPLYFLYDFVLRMSDGYFTYGERGRRRMIGLGYDPAKIHPVYNSLNDGVDPEAQRRLKSDVLSRRFGNSDPTLLFIGRLTPRKKLDRLVDMLARLNGDGLGCNLLFIGDGPEAASLRRHAEEAGVDGRIWFFGECHDEETLGELVYNCDICCSPGNVGLTALHAMSYGVPVASHDDFDTQMPEFETISHGETGVLFRKDDPKDMIVKTARWLRDHSTAEAREKARRACHAMINTRWNSRHQISIIQRVLQGDSDRKAPEVMENKDERLC